MNDKLKLCPFCGEIKLSVYLAIIEDTSVEMVYCPTCYEGVGKSVSFPAEVWNTRPLEDALTTEVERLRKALKSIKELVGKQRNYQVCIMINQALRGDE